jgi:sugar phosphate isomerase/epimerase
MLSRRDFAKIAVAAAVPATLIPATLAAQTAGRGARPIPKPNSRFAGVQVGVITYSFNGVPPADMLSTIGKLGISEVEIMSNHAEAMVSAPTPAPAARGGAAPAAGGRGPGAGNAGRGGQAPPAQPAISWYTGQMCEGRPAPAPPASGAAARPAPVIAPEIAQWRSASSTLDKYKDLRKQFDDAGIDLAILCYNMNGNIGDDEIDYAFRMAQALGVKAISSSSTVTIAQRVAAFADRYKMIWAGHGHDDVCDPEQFARPETFEKIMALSPYIGVNLDIGHFTAAGYDPVQFIRRYHDRITNLHLKDRTRNPIRGRGGNVRWGDGETPIVEVLQLLRREQYPIPANIEYEYQGTDPVIEVAKCLQFAKDALLA